MWPALGNLTGRRPRGLVLTYGESEKHALTTLARGAEVVRCLPSIEAFACVLRGALQQTRTGFKVTNTNLSKPVPALNVMQFGISLWDDSSRFVMRRSFGVARGSKGVRLGGIFR